MQMTNISTQPEKSMRPEDLWRLAETRAPGFSFPNGTSRGRMAIRFENQAPTRTVSVSQNIPTLR